MLDGDPGLDKSTITVDLTGRVSTASPMPDGHLPDEPMKVLLLSAEDGAADTIRPRLEVAGARTTAAPSPWRSPRTWTASMSTSMPKRATAWRSSTR